MSAVLVSIIIPTYNRAHVIRETLDSVLAQTHTNWECIIVDDKSTDDTISILEDYQKKDSRFLIVNKTDLQKKGASTSRNIGLSHAKGEYIQFLDSDDLLAANKLEMQLELLIEKSIYTVSTCKWGRFEQISNPIQLYEDNAEFKSFSNVKDYFDLMGIVGGFFPPHSFLVHKKMIYFSGFWNENLSHNDDGEFFFRILLNADGIVFSDKTYVLYRVNSFDNLSILNSEEKAISLLNSWKIAEALYISKYNETESLYMNRRKSNVYHEFKKQYPQLIHQNKDFFTVQIKNDNLFLKIRKLKKRIKNRLKIILNGGREGLV